MPQECAPRARGTSLHTICPRNTDSLHPLTVDRVTCETGDRGRGTPAPALSSNTFQAVRPPEALGRTVEPPDWLCSVEAKAAPALGGCRVMSLEDPPDAPAELPLL